MVSACLGSRTMVTADTSRKPTAIVMSSPTPGAFSRTIAKPMYAPAESVSSNAASWASRSSPTRRSGDEVGVAAVRTACQVKPVASAPNEIRMVRAASLTATASVCLEEIQRIDLVVGRIDGRDHALERAAGPVPLRLPEIAFERQVETCPFGIEEDAHARTVRIRRVDAQDDGDL